MGFFCLILTVSFELLILPRLLARQRYCQFTILVLCAVSWAFWGERLMVYILSLPKCFTTSIFKIPGPNWQDHSIHKLAHVWISINPHTVPFMSLEALVYVVEGGGSPPIVVCKTSTFCNVLFGQGIHNKMCEKCSYFFTSRLDFVVIAFVSGHTIFSKLA